jgi:hypothetical protein
MAARSSSAQALITIRIVFAESTHHDHDHNHVICKSIALQLTMYHPALQRLGLQLICKATEIRQMWDKHLPARSEDYHRNHPNEAAVE